MLPYRGQARRFAAAGLLALTLPAAALAACAGPAKPGPGAVTTPRTVVRDRTVTTPPGTGSSAGAVCAATSPARLRARARVVFTGAFLPGPAVRPDGRHLLLSPARLRVTRYLKGHGPRIVWVETAVSKKGSAIAENSDGILARAGQEWKIFTTSRNSPFLTSSCDGSRPLAGDRAIP